MKWCLFYSINVNLWNEIFSMDSSSLKLKLLYFSVFAGLSPFTSFGPTLAKQLGLSAGAVGCIYFTGVLSSILGRLVFGYVADKFRMHKVLLVFVASLCSVTFIFVVLLPQPRNEDKTLTFEKKNSSFISICFKNQERVETFTSKIGIDGKRIELYCPTNNESYSVVFLKTHYEIENVTYYVVNIADIQENCCFIGERWNTNSNSKNINNTFKSKSYDCFINTTDEPTPFSQELLFPIFWMFGGLYLGYSVTSSIISVFVDTICFQSLGTESHKFGKLRMFASMGWGISGLISGLSVDYFSSETEIKNYSPIFIMSFSFVAVSTLGFFLMKMPTFKANVKIKTTDLLYLFRNLRSLIFAFWCFSIGVYSAAVWQYSFWIVEDVILKKGQGWNKTIQGLMIILNTFFGDVPAYFFFGRIISSLGFTHCMTLTLLMNSLRLFFYSVLQSPVWALANSVLDGCTYGISYAVITSYANLISRDDSKTTVQVIFNVVFDGIGTSFGGLCFGFLHNWYGGSYAFQLFSIVAFFNAVLLAIINFFMKNYNV